MCGRGRLRSRGMARTFGVVSILLLLAAGCGSGGTNDAADSAAATIESSDPQSSAPDAAGSSDAGASTSATDPGSQDAGDNGPPPQTLEDVQQAILDAGMTCDGDIDISDREGAISDDPQYALPTADLECLVEGVDVYFAIYRSADERSAVNESDFPEPCRSYGDGGVAVLEEGPWSSRFFILHNEEELSVLHDIADATGTEVTIKEC